MVYEEDTFRVMSADNIVRERRRPDTDALIAEAAAQEVNLAGDLVVKGSRWYAVVYDFESDPVISDRVISEVLEKVSVEAGKKELVAIAIQALGAYRQKQSCAAFSQQLKAIAWPPSLRRIWVVDGREEHLT